MLTIGSGMFLSLLVSIDQTVEIVKKHITERGWNHLTHYWTGDGDHAGFDSSAMGAFVGSGVPESIPYRFEWPYLCARPSNG